MKEIKVEFIKELIKKVEIPFIPTQTKLCIPIIIRLCQKMAHGIKFDDIKVCENLIIDGHHRYLSALMMNFKLGKVEGNITSATLPVAWDKVEFDEQDWDTPAKIAHLNELDAKYNGLDIEFVKQIVLD